MRFKFILNIDSLRGRIRIYALIMMSIPVVLTLFSFTFFQRDQIIHNEIIRTSELLKQEKIVIEAFISERFADVSFLAIMQNTFNSPSDIIKKTYYDYVVTHPGISAAVYANAFGYSTTDTTENYWKFIGDRHYFTEAKAGRRAITTGIRGRVSGKPICIFSCPVLTENGIFNGVVFVAMQTDVLSAWLRGLFDAGRQNMVLCDAQGRILTSLPEMPANADRQDATVAPQLMNIAESGQIDTDASGRRMIGASISVGQSGWRLICYQAEDVVLAGYRWQVACMVMGTFVTMLLLAPLILRFCKNLERPLEKLTAYALELRKKNYADPDALPTTPHMAKEFRILFDAFKEMGQRVTNQIHDAEEASLRDVLTGLHNRRYLLETGAAVLNNALRAGRPCACLILDIDRFKNVNDAFGHKAGDTVLQHAAQTIRSCARQSDLLVRYGGEEFVILAADAGTKQAEQLALRIIEAMNAHCCMINGQKVTVTVSIGVACLRDKVEFGASLLDDMLARADKALYQAKRSGRNTVVVAP